MADIFISYAREDRETAKTLAQALADQGWSVWWDRHIPTGRRFHDVIEHELAAARCVIALWSKAALTSDWVREEAQDGLERDILVPAKIEPGRPPIGFRTIQTADLSEWKGNPAHSGFMQLVQDIRAVLGKASPQTSVAKSNLFISYARRDQETAKSKLQRPGGKLGTPPKDIHFTIYPPIEIKPKVWFTLLVYVHTLKIQTEVEKDAKQRLQVPHSHRSTKAIHTIARGAEIVIVPELPGCRFNPPFARLLWLEDWHRIEFRLQAQSDITGFELGKAVNGRVAFYVESVLVGEVSIWTCISDEADTTAADTPASTASAEPYEAIFVSYAHEDSAVVDKLGRAYKVLGMKFLRDVEALRSGEKWNPTLLTMIEYADIFQLYWSRAASAVTH